MDAKETRRGDLWLSKNRYMICVNEAVILERYLVPCQDHFQRDTNGNERCLSTALIKKLSSMA